MTTQQSLAAVAATVQRVPHHLSHGHEVGYRSSEPDSPCMALKPVLDCKKREKKVRWTGEILVGH